MTGRARVVHATFVCLLALQICHVRPGAVSRVQPPRLADAIRAAATTDVLRAFYEPRKYEPLWTGTEGLTAGADAAVALLRGAPDDGLRTADYLDAPLARLLAGVESVARSDTAVIASIEVGLSAAVLRFLADVHLGRIDPRLVGYQMRPGGDGTRLAARLSPELARGPRPDTVERLRPRYAQYAALRRKLADYRALAADRRLTPPALPQQSLGPGDRLSAARQLQTLLAAVGDMPRDQVREKIEPVYQGALVAGVQAFQRRHGLDADGIIGPRTRAALQTPLARRVRQLELALERLRWLPDFGDKRLIAMNIPMYHLWAFDAVRPGGVPALDMNVIVGRAARTETPVLIDALEEVVFRPWWNVPPSILRNEILPALSREPGYLQRHDMELAGGRADGSQPTRVSPEIRAAMRRGAIGVRQRPGSGNALGLVKFVFPNDENVYMHGTPAQELFARSRRDFSHGCVRLEDPVALAEWALRDSGDWDRTRIEGAMNGRTTVTVRLRQAIPVVLFYTTAAVIPKDDAVWFADDVYGGDRRLERALALRPQP